MTVKEVAEIISAVCAMISVACTVYIVGRDARWRKTGLAAQLESRMTGAERAAAAAMDQATRWHETQTGKVWEGQMNHNTSRIGRCEEVLQHVATREDLERVSGKLGRIESIAENAASGIDRIETMLMTKALRS